MKNSIFLLLTLCFLCQCSCKKSILANDNDDNPPMTELEKLPPITSEGANTFGCLIDGEAWTPKGYIFPDANFDVYYDEVYYHGLNVSMYKKRDNNQTTQYVSFALRLKGNTPNIDTIHNVNLYGFDSCIVYDKFLYKDFSISKLDTVNKLVSGVFNFDVVREEAGCFDTLMVTDGRFDAIYRY